MGFSSRIFRLVLTSASLTAVSAGSLARRSGPPYPSNDPFYDPPAGYQSTAPGSILNSRSIEAGFLGLVPEDVNAYQLLYRTTAVNGTPIATVTTIFQPNGSPNDRFVSFQTAYDSSWTECDPSYDYQEGASQTDLITSAEEFLIEAFLIEGWTVASPDYEGPEAAFGPGLLEGMGVLDGMTAVQSFQSLGLISSPMIVGVGYSGGAIATGWAASLQSNYAPNLNVVGWSIGGTPANLTGTLENLSGGVFAGFSFAGVVGLLKPSAYGAQLVDVVDSFLTDVGSFALDWASDHCSIDNLITFFEQSFLSTEYQSQGAQLLYNPQIAAVLEQTVMGVYQNETPIAPVYMYHASQDEVIPYDDAYSTSQAWCDNGATVQFTTFEAGGHATTEILGFPGAFDFVKDAFAGATPSGCSYATALNNSLSPLALGANLEPIINKLIDGLDLFGDMDSNVVQNVSVLNQNIPQ